jgi:hypothetical protein
MHYLHVAAGKAGATILVRPEHVVRGSSTCQLCWLPHGGARAAKAIHARTSS